MGWIVLGRAIHWLLVLALAFLLVFVAVNAFDRELSADAKRLGAVTADPYPPEQNLYISLKGFSALPSESVVAVGQQRIAEENARIDLYLRTPQWSKDEFATPELPRLSFDGAIEFCKGVVISCWADVAAHRAQIESLVNANAELYGRYLALHGTQGYVETVRQTLITDLVWVPEKVRSLFLAHVALRLKTGDDAQRRAALNELTADMRLWRTVIRGDGNVLSKIWAILSLHGDLLLLGEMVADRSVDIKPYAETIEEMLAVMQPSDWNIAGFVASEYQMNAAIIERLRHAPFSEKAKTSVVHRAVEHVMKYFLQERATVNEFAKNFAALQRVANTGPEMYRDSQREFEAQLKTGFGFRYIYNPVGRFLVDSSNPDYTNYILRGHDGEAFQRLVRLAYEIRKYGIPGDQVPMFIVRSGERATHPVNGEPFAWDPKRHILWMNPLGNGSTKPRFEIAFAGPQ